MSNKSDKKKQEELKQRNEQLEREATAARAAAATPSPVQTEQETQALDWFKFLKDPNRDFSKFAGLPFDSAIEEGAAGAEEDRTALGAMRFGGAAADPNLQAVLKENFKERRVQRRGQALENAVSRYDSLMRGLAGDVAAQDQARRLGVANLTTGASQNSLNTYAAFTPRPHWGLTLGAAAIAGGSRALTGGA